MSINKKRIRSLSGYLPGLSAGKTFRVARPAADVVAGELQKIGFPDAISAGDSLIPKGVGPVSEFNANGRDVTRKDLPKELRHYSVYTSWNDWHGYPHSGYQTRSIMAFPIQHIGGPAEALAIADSCGKLFVTSRVLVNDEPTAATNLHVVNLFLEIFGQCEILDENINAIALPQVRSLNWRILPRGKYPWDKAKEHFQNVTKFLPKNERAIVEYRLQYISAFHPDFIAVGEGGFSGYFVLGFSGKPLFIFESIHLGNATYAFRKDWETVSKLSKSEIIRTGVHHARIVHGDAWKRHVTEVLR